MRQDRTSDDGYDGLQGGSEAREPFRASGSGESYDPAGNWGAERRLDKPTGGVPTGMEGRASGAGDGGYGPEGDYAGAAGAPNAEVLGQVNADRDPLVREAQQEGPPRADRAFVGGDRGEAEGPANQRGIGAEGGGEGH
jgi:hypothetical protein